MTGDQLLDGIKRRITMPANQYLLSDSDILAFADDVISTHIVPILKSVQWEFFVKMDTFNTVANQSEYDINYRAVGRALRDIKMRVSATDETTKDLVYIEPENSHLYATQAEPFGFFFRGDQIVLVPEPTVSTYVIEVSYFLMPGSIIKEGDAAKVVSVASNIVNTTGVPSTISNGTVVDFIKGKSGHRTITIDYAVSSVGGSQIVFPDATQTQYLSAGDYISVGQTSPVVQLPPQCDQLLKTLTGMYCLQAVDDAEGAMALEKAAAAEKDGLMMTISPRVVGENKKILNLNGLIRRGNSYFRTGGRYVP